MEIAIGANDGDIVRQLIRHGVSVNKTYDIGDDRYNGLLLACLYGNANSAAALISCGGDVNATSRDGVTPLMAAAGSGKGQCVRLLIDRGADVNYKTSDGETALADAVQQKRADVVAILRAAGAR